LVADGSPVERWAAATSPGPWVGIAICLAWLVALGALLLAFLQTPSLPTRLVIWLSVLPITLLLVVSLVVTQRSFSLGYLLGPTALEIHAGNARYRLRYDQIADVNGPPVDLMRPGEIWPGAYAGHRERAHSRSTVWIASTKQPESVVLVRGERVELALTPRQLDGFRAQLRDRVREAPWAVGGGPTFRMTWLDRLVDVDGWTRLLAGIAVWLAAVSLAVAVGLEGAASRGHIVATVLTVTNVGLAAVLTVRSDAVGAARLLLIVAIVLQPVAVAT
jgi:hypothetical protein